MTLLALLTSSSATELPPQCQVAGADPAKLHLAAIREMPIVDALMALLKKAQKVTEVRDLTERAATGTFRHFPGQVFQGHGFAEMIWFAGQSNHDWLNWRIRNHLDTLGLTPREMQILGENSDPAVVARINEAVRLGFVIPEVLGQDARVQIDTALRRLIQQAVKDPELMRRINGMDLLARELYKPESREFELFRFNWEALALMHLLYVAPIQTSETALYQVFLKSNLDRLTLGLLTKDPKNPWKTGPDKKSRIDKLLALWNEKLKGPRGPWIRFLLKALVTDAPVSVVILTLDGCIRCGQLKEQKVVDQIHDSGVAVIEFAAGAIPAGFEKYIQAGTNAEGQTVMAFPQAIYFRGAAHEMTLAGTDANPISILQTIQNLRQPR